MTMKGKIFLAIGVGLLFLVSGSLFTVSQREQAIITQFGRLVRAIQEPGLHFKIPMIQEGHFYDRRVLEFDIPDTEVTLGDQKRIVVDTFTCYKIQDPAQFFKSVRNQQRAEARLYTIVTGTLRKVLGQTTLMELLSSKREEVMHRIWRSVKEASTELGIDIIDLRIRKTDLPQENSQAIFNRMISERRQEAAGLRAKGREQARIIQANADRDRTILLAQAQKKAMILIGQGSQDSMKIYEQNYQKHLQGAFEFLRLQAYRHSFESNTNAYVLSENDFYTLFSQDKTGTSSSRAK